MSSKNTIEKIEMLREAFKSYFFEAGDELAAAPPAAPAVSAPAPAQQPQQQQTPNPDQTMDPLAQGQQQATPEYTVQQFVDSMNKIRGGRSFDDQDVYQQVNTLFTNLDPVSKETLRNVVGQIESIVTPIQNQGQPEQPQGDGNLPTVQDTNAYNSNVNAPAGAPPAPPASFAAPQEAPPA